MVLHVVRTQEVGAFQRVPSWEWEHYPVSLKRVVVDNVHHVRLLNTIFRYISHNR